MKLKLFFLLALLIQILNSQESEVYKNLTSQIKPLETKKIERKFKNGNIKEVYFLTTYEHNGVKYYLYSGKYYSYWRNGTVSEERDHDMFGVPLFTNWYYWNGDVSMKNKATEIETNAKSIKEFLESDKHLIRRSYSEYFVPLNGEKDKPILVKKGEEINGKRVGLWKFYRKGKLVKEKVYRPNLLKIKENALQQRL